MTEDRRIQQPGSTPPAALEAPGDLDAPGRFRDIFDQSVVPIVVVGLDGAFIEANGAFGDLLGRPSADLRGRSLADVADADACDRDRDALDTALVGDTRGYHLVSQRFRHRTGREIWASVTATVVCDADGRPRHVVQFVEDITGRRSLELHLRQALRVEMVAQLGSGLAHDLNNVLAVLQGHLDLLEADLDPTEAVSRRLTALHEALQRANGVTSGMLSISRSPVHASSSVEVDGLVAAVARLTSDVLGDGIVVDLDLGAEGAAVLVDAGQLEQSLISMILNARDAMPAGGHLLLRTRRGTEPSRSDGHHPTPVVQIEVHDTGIGMDGATQAQAFTPFFTTKPPGVGTGLGLAQSLRAVRLAGGTITLESAVGEGTVVRTTLPVHRVTDAPASLLDLDAAEPVAES